MPTRSPAETAAAYFAAINARDTAGIQQVFAAQAELITPAGRVVGPAAIAEFYAAHAFTAADLHAQPGPLLVDGDRVGVEIVLQMHGGRTRVADFFEIRAGCITRLAVYLAGPA